MSAPFIAKPSSWQRCATKEKEAPGRQQYETTIRVRKFTFHRQNGGRENEHEKMIEKVPDIQV